MTRDEYLAMLDTEPATPNQLGAIHREFGRLGFHPQRDRAERLAICARLLGIDALGSTADLTMGQAGQLVNALLRICDRADVPAIPRGAELADDNPPQADDGQDHDDAADVGEFISVAEAINRIMIMIVMAVYVKELRAGSGNIAPNVRRSRATGAFPAQGRANSADQSSAPHAGARGESISDDRG